MTAVHVLTGQSKSGGNDLKIVCSARVGVRSHFQRHWGVGFSRLGLFVGVVVVVPGHSYHRGGFDRLALISESAVIVRVERDPYVALAWF